MMEKPKRQIFSVSERRGILYLLPLVMIVCGVLFLGRRPKSDTHLKEIVDIIEDTSAKRYDTSYARTATRTTDERTGKQEKPQAELFAFDPNTVSLGELVRLGFSERQAQGILNYRAAGKVFRAPEDFAKCYTVSEEMFRRLRPYIIIPVTAATVTVVTEAAPAEDTAGKAVHEPKPLVNVNSADSMALCTVSGIGPVTAGRIVEYRAKLGGYADVKQLAEVRGVTEANFERILKEIFVDSSGIQKIDVNFANPKRLQEHPYMDDRTLRKLLKNRQLKGGWSTIEDMVNDDILTRRQAERLAPYLLFSPVQ